MPLHDKLSHKGLFITFEGNEGVGKSTQSRRLAERLEGENYKVLFTREPGGTKGAEALRNLLLFEGADFSPGSEILLHMAARLDHVEKVIRPALFQGQIVICDRFHDSTMAYQAYGASRGDQKILELVTFLRYFINCEADLTFWLDMPLEEAFSRVRKRGEKTNYYEAKEMAFHERVREGFVALAHKESDRMIQIDATPAAEEIQAKIYQKVKEFLLQKRQ